MNKRRAFTSFACGGLLGTLISFIVAAVLLEISGNEFFAIYFGVLFFIVGLAIIRRITMNSVWTEGGRLSRFVLALFSLIILTASVSCFIVDYNVLKLSPAQRVPFFIILGSSVSFVVTFALIDVVNSFVKSVHTSKQVFLVLFSSVSTGLLFGLVFGLLDSEDDPSKRHALIRDERYCAPVGFVVGSITSLIISIGSHLDEHNTTLNEVKFEYGNFFRVDQPRNFDDGL